MPKIVLDIHMCFVQSTILNERPVFVKTGFLGFQGPSRQGSWAILVSWVDLRSQNSFSSRIMGNWSVFCYEPDPTFTATLTL